MMGHHFEWYKAGLAIVSTASDFRIILVSAEKMGDANAMELVAKAGLYETHKLLTRDATAENVLENIGKAAQKLISGDMFVLTFSGHGGQIDDVNGDELDGLDETWGLYDRMLVDDE